MTLLSMCIVQMISFLVCTERLNPPGCFLHRSGRFWSGLEIIWGPHFRSTRNQFLCGLHGDGPSVNPSRRDPVTTSRGLTGLDDVGWTVDVHPGLTSSYWLCPVLTYLSLPIASGRFTSVPFPIFWKKQNSEVQSQVFQIASLHVQKFSKS